VFRATDLRLDRSVALKILPPEQARDPEIAQRFQDEARAAARLDHENIARVFFVGEDRALHFIAFEFVEGVNVREIIAQCGPLPPHEVVNYALQIAGALVHAASRGVVHRDIKPSNIIITMEGRAKLVDMGLARNFERRHDGALTQSNITLGTFDYIAPEQARDPRSADVRSDIYSFGCTLFHMLTGRPPYPEGTLLQKLLKHQEESPPDPRELNPLVPAHLAAVVQRMMAKDPARRQPNPRELMSELLEIAADMGLRSTSPEGLIWVSNRPGASISKLTAGIWLTAAALLLIAVWRLHSASTAVPAGFPDGGRSEVSHAGPEDRSDANTSRADPGDGSRRLNGAEPVEVGNQQDPQGNELQLVEPTDASGHAASEVFVVGPGQDLRAIIAQAPSGSVIELTGDHRPRLFKVDDTAGIRIEGKRLTIKAAPGSRPRLILSYDPQAFGVADWNLLTVVNGQLELEGVQLEIQTAAVPNSPMAMIAVQSSKVTLRRCSFFQAWALTARDVPRREDEAEVWAAHLDRGIGLDGRIQPAQVIAAECFFGGGDGAFRLAGSAQADFTDCVFLPYRSAFLIRSAGSASAPPADVRLNNVSLFGSGGPIFDLAFSRVVVSSQAVVFSHEAPTQGVLACLDVDSRLEWRGKRNTYYGLRQYLEMRDSAEPESMARRFSDWIELTRDVSEVDSTETDRSPWLLTLAEAAARNTNDTHVADAFRMARPADDPTWRPHGSRFALPWGALYDNDAADSTAAQRVKQFARGIAGVTGNGSTDRSTSNGDARNDKTSKAESATTSRAVTESPGSTGSKLEENMKKIINTMPNIDSGAVAHESSAAVNRSATEGTASSGASRVLVVDPVHPGSISTIAAACARAEDGAVIEIRHSGRLREGPIELGDRHLTIRAASGYRPIIEFIVNQLDLKGHEPRLFDIRRGSLTLKDLDLHIVADASVSTDTWAAVACRGADLIMDGCTVAVEAGAGVTSSVVRFLTSDVDDPMTAPTGDILPLRPQFQLRNSLAVGMSQLVRVQPAVRVRMEIENCALDVQDNLIAVLGGMERSVVASLNEIEIRHATVRMRNGLVSYEANEARGWLPRLEITAYDNLFVSETDSPWLRFRSPRPADELRGLLRWKGMNNSYDGVTAFWHIESMASGELELFSWDEWTRSPARDEIKADRGRIEFVAQPAATAPWQRTRYHFKPVPAAAAGEMASDGGNRGADLTIIPAPPTERESGRQ
jgi:serine/threonine-protein kinase